MVKIKYIGDISPVSIKVYSATYKGWNRNEVRDIGEFEAEKLVTENANFEVVKAVEAKKEVKIKPKPIKEEIVFEEENNVEESD